MRDGLATLWHQKLKQSKLVRIIRLALPDQHWTLAMLRAAGRGRVLPINQVILNFDLSQQAKKQAYCIQGPSNIGSLFVAIWW